MSTRSRRKVNKKKLLTLGLTAVALLLIPRRSSRQDAYTNDSYADDIESKDRQATDKTNDHNATL